MKKINVMHIVDDLNPAKGGSVRSALNLAEEMSVNLQDFYSISLLTQKVLQEPQLSCSELYSPLEILTCQYSSEFSRKFGYSYYKKLNNLIDNKKIDLIYSHGVWRPVNHYASLVARKKQIPIIIQPHGMLQPWPMSQKYLKKYFGMLLYQKKNLINATAIVASTYTEYEDIRRLGIKTPIAVIPNGFDLNQFYIEENKFKHSNTSGKKTALFLSRIHNGKGLLSLIRAWAIIRPDSWKLIIAGPDEGHIEDVLLLASNLGISSSVDYVGEVYGIEKQDLFRTSNLFILPSISESFGLVVVEALGYGLPVIATKGAPWSDLEKYGCGWWADLGVDGLVTCLRSALELTAEELSLKGRIGKNYIERFGWNSVLGSYSELYNWTLNLTSKPDFIQID